MALICCFFAWSAVFINKICYSIVDGRRLAWEKELSEIIIHGSLLHIAHPPIFCCEFSGKTLEEVTTNLLALP